MGDAVVSGGYQSLLGDLVALLEHARDVVARNVNTVMTAEHWSVGPRIVEEEQAGSERAVYGAETMERLAADLTSRFGRGYSIDNLFLMWRFRRPGRPRGFWNQRFQNPPLWRSPRSLLLPGWTRRCGRYCSHFRGLPMCV